MTKLIETVELPDYLMNCQKNLFFCISDIFYWKILIYQ